MKLRVSLFDGRVTRAQQWIVFAWSLALAGVLMLWFYGSFPLLKAGSVSLLLAGGRLAGMLATFFALTQFMLMGRIGWIERSFGLDRLASYHRLNGYMAITLIILHPILIVGSYALASGIGFLPQYIATLNGHPFAWLALISEILFIFVVLSSVYIARRRMSFEWWYGVHMLVYLAIVIVPFHQIASGTSLSLSPIGVALWVSMYGFVTINIFVWRLAKPVYDLHRFRFEVAKVVTETPTVTSIYIKGRDMQRFRAVPGQFILVRFLTKHLGAQEHPFSLSLPPSNDMIRISVRAVGGYTNALKKLKPGTRVVVSGPFGRFTQDVAVTGKRLFIAGGIGITPIRTLLEESQNNQDDSVLIYANRSSNDVPLKQELEKLHSKKTKIIFVYDDDSRYANQSQIDAQYIARVVPDVIDRDIYICGPPAMTTSIIAGLAECGVPTDQIHFERFAFIA